MEAFFTQVSCLIGGKHLHFGEREINQTFDLKTENHDAVTTDDQMVEFLEFIHYAAAIDMGKLNKKNVRREWSFLFDALQKVFLCRKTGCDQISHITVRLLFSCLQSRDKCWSNHSKRTGWKARSKSA